MRDPSDWCFVSGVVSAREGQLFADSFYSALLSSVTIEEVFVAVTDTPLKDAFPRASALTDADAIVSQRAHHELVELRRYCPDPLVVDMFLLRNEFYNVKGYLKEKLAELSVETVPDGRVSRDDVERLWEALETPFDDVLAAPVRRLRALASEPPVDVATLVDWVMDAAYLDWSIRAARGIGSPLIERYVERWAVLSAVGMFWRARDAGIEAARLVPIVLVGELARVDLREVCTADAEQRPALLARFMPEAFVQSIFAGEAAELMERFQVEVDRYLVGLAREMKHVPFGPERVFGYLSGLTRQTHNLRLCFAGRANRIEPALLKRRLRESYA